MQTGPVLTLVDTNEHCKTTTISSNRDHKAMFSERTVGPT